MSQSHLASTDEGRIAPPRLCLIAMWFQPMRTYGALALSHSHLASARCFEDNERQETVSTVSTGSINRTSRKGRPHDVYARILTSLDTSDLGDAVARKDAR